MMTYDGRETKVSNVAWALDTTTVSPTSARTLTSSCNNEYQWFDATSTNIIDLNAHRASSKYAVSRILARSGSPFRSTYEQTLQRNDDGLKDHQKHMGNEINRQSILSSLQRHPQ